MGGFKLILLIPFFTFAQLKPVQTWKTIDPTVKHVYGSIFLTCGVAQLHYNLSSNKNRGKSILIGSSTSLLIGVVGKELIHDKYLKRGVYDGWDIMDDCWGTLIGCIVMTCKFDLDENGLVRWRDVDKPKKSKFDKKKYILD